MDRILGYPGEIMLIENILSTNRHAATGLGAFANMVYGAAAAYGFACTPSGMSVSVGSGSVIANNQNPIDQGAYGNLPASIMPAATQYYLAQAVALTFAAGTTTTIYATGTVSDTGSIVLPYYNAANPSQPFNGPNNGGTSQPTMRQNLLTIAAASAVPATGIPLWTVTVPSGATAVTAAMIAPASGSPFYLTLPQMATLPRTLIFNSTSFYPVPFGVYRLRKVWCYGGGGGGGGSGNAGSIASGGDGPGYAEAYDVPVQPGQIIPVTIGAAGLAGVYNGQNPTAGGTSYFGSFVSATGGQPGQSAGGNTIAGPSAGPGQGTIAAGLTGQAFAGTGGGTGYNAGSTNVGGNGGGSFQQPGVGLSTSSSTIPQAGGSGTYPGQGGAGGLSGGNGGAGAAGQIGVELY